MHQWETVAREKLGVTTNPLDAGYILWNGEFLDCLTRTADRVWSWDAVAVVAGDYPEYRRQVVERAVKAGVPKWVAMRSHAINRSFAVATGAIRVHILRRSGRIELSCELCQPPSRRQIRAIWDIPDLWTMRCDLVEPGNHCIKCWHEEGRPAVEAFLERLPQNVETMLVQSAHADESQRQQRERQQREAEERRSASSSRGSAI